MKPPRFAAPIVKVVRPKFGIGIVVGVLLILASQASGSESAFAMVLGGGAGIALGLTGRSGTEKLTEEASSDEEEEESWR